MSKPIYEMWMRRNNLTSNQIWKAFSEAEIKALMDQESKAAVGAKDIVVCDSQWADETYNAWGVKRFPDLQARIEHTRRLQKIGWFDILDTFSLMGTSDTEPVEVTIPNPIYKLWIIRNNPAMALTRNLPKGLDALKWEKHNALYKEYNSQVILYCGSSWCNEAYLSFGVSAYPDIEANMKIMEGLNELGWPGYFDCVSYLGIPFSEG